MRTYRRVLTSVVVNTTELNSVEETQHFSDVVCTRIGRLLKEALDTAPDYRIEHFSVLEKCNWLLATLVIAWEGPDEIVQPQEPDVYQLKDSADPAEYRGII